MNTNSIICRTCLNIISDEKLVHTIQKEMNILDKMIHIKDIIKSCIPEVQLEVTTNPVICTPCLNILIQSYTFKMSCIVIENRISSFKSSSNEDHINLGNVLDYQERDSTSNDLPMSQENHLNDMSQQITNPKTLSNDSLKKEILLSKRQCIINLNPSLPQQYNYKTLTVKVQKQNIVTCLYCDTSYLNVALLNEHNKKKHRTCGLCNFATDRLSKLGQHLHAVHQEAIESQLQQFESNLTFKCSLCGISTSSKLDLRDHRLKSHIQTNVNGRYICPYTECCEENIIAFLILKHIEKTHDKKILQCQVCNYATNLLYNYQKHVKSHIKKKLTCVLCSKELKNIFGFKQHIKRKHPGTEYQFFQSVFDRSALDEYAAKFVVNDYSRRSSTSSSEQDVIEMIDLTSSNLNSTLTNGNMEEEDCIIVTPNNELGSNNTSIIDLS